MKLENQVCSLKQAKRLKELGGFPDSVFYWKQNSRSKWYVGYSSMQNTYKTDKKVCPAFNVAELGVMLPNYTFHYKGSECMIVCNTIGIFSYVNIHAIGTTSSLCMTQGSTEAQARAAMLIHLLENNLITAQEVNERLKQS